MNWTHALEEQKEEESPSLLSLLPCGAEISDGSLLTPGRHHSSLWRSKQGNRDRIPVISCENKTRSCKIIIENSAVKFFPVVTGTRTQEEQKKPSFHCYIIYKLQLEEFANYDLLAGSVLESAPNQALTFKCDTFAGTTKHDRDG